MIVSTTTWIRITLLAALPALSGWQSESTCHPGAPGLIVVGTVLEVQVPQTVCVATERHPSPESCFTTVPVTCESRQVASLQAPGQPVRTVELTSVDPGLPEVRTLQLCDQTAGRQQVTLCPDDAQPIRCEVTAHDSETTTIGIAIEREPTRAWVRVRVESVELGQAPPEIGFEPRGLKDHDLVVGSRGRFELRLETPALTGRTEPGRWTRWPCYQQEAQRPAGHHGCAGCNAKGSDGLGTIFVLGAIAGLLVVRRR